MSDSLNLNTTPLFINASDDAEVQIQNGGPGTVYYSTANTVSSSSNDGSIAAGTSLQSRAPKWIVTTTTSKVFIAHTPVRDDTHNVHGIEDFTQVALLSDLAVVGETLNIDFTTSAAAQTLTIQAAIDAVDSQGGGSVLLPWTTETAATSIQIDDPLLVPRRVALRGQGKIETEINATTADSCIWWDKDEVSNRRGGESGGFTFNGASLATSCLRFDGVNRGYRDIKVTSPATSGIMYEIGTDGSTSGAQNHSFTNIEGDNEAANAGVIGMVIDQGSAGCNFSDTVFTFCDTVLVIDNSDAALATDGPKNLTFKGFMWERGITTTPLIHIKAGRNIVIKGGNLAHTYLDNTAWADAAAAYNIVLVDASNSASRTTKAISFENVYVQGSQHSSTNYATGFNIASDMTAAGAWVSIKNCTFQNCLNGHSCEAATNQVTARDNDYTGTDNPYRTAASGKPNTYIAAAAATYPTRPTIDYYEASGNTTINNFTATYPGHRITIKFSGAPTVSSSAGNIKLSGLSDMSATADDLLSLIFDGTNWHETGRVVK